MDANRRRHIEDVCDAALQLEERDRSAYLAEACGPDAALRRAVEDLLAYEHAARGFLSSPRVFDTLSAVWPDGQSLVGTRLGPYQVVALLGHGGMGAVYRARDARLDRDVAIKVVRHYTTDGVSRLRNEAKAVARLNHPSICTVYEVAVADGIACIAMELIDGVPLSSAIPNAGMPAERVRAIGRQIAEALDHAHANGVIHRDLKGANVMLLRGDRVKVIDFGIADRAIRPTDQTETDRGVSSGLSGTLPYLAPELLRGAAPDARSDLWSLGVVLFEMATGRRPFTGETAPHLTAAILRDPHPPLPQGVTTALSTIIEQCLVKDPARRPASAMEVAAALQQAMRRRTPRAETRTGGMVGRAAIAALAVVSIAAMSYAVWPSPDPTPAPMRFGNPKLVTTTTGVEEFAAWSPDGRTLAYSASVTGHLVDRWDIWVTQISGGTPINRTLEFGRRNMFPQWSPDGTLISFWSDRDGGGCYVMPALNGAPRRVANGVSSDPNPPEWSADGTRLTCVAGTIEQPVLTTVSVETSAEIERIPLPGDAGLRRMFVTRSPDGTRLAFAMASAGLDADLAQLFVYELGSSTLHALTDGRTKAWSPTWSRDGRRLFYVDVSGGSMDLKEQPVTAEGRADGPPRTLTAGIGMRSAVLSEDGARLAYSSGRKVGNVYRVPYRRDRAATWADAEQLTFDQASVQCMDLDPSGTTLALSSDRSGSFDLWTMPVTGGNLTQVTSDPSAEWCPVWSPDATSFAFFAYRSGNRDIWTMPVKGGEWRQVTTNQAADLHPRWTFDGKAVVYLSVRERAIGMWMSSFDGAPDRLVNASIKGGTVSPVDRRFATRDADNHITITDLDGRTVRTFSTTSPTSSTWTSDGEKLLIRSTPDRISALDLETGANRLLVDLSGRRGSLNIYGTPSDGKFVYFIWEENLGDIWTMDVLPSLSPR